MTNHDVISAVTDSAAGATAMSCGLKTYNGAIGVDAQGKPCGTILEGKERRGERTRGRKRERRA